MKSKKLFLLSFVTLSVMSSIGHAVEKIQWLTPMQDYKTEQRNYQTEVSCGSHGSSYVKEVIAAGSMCTSDERHTNCQQLSSVFCGYIEMIQPPFYLIELPFRGYNHFSVSLFASSIRAEVKESIADALGKDLTSNQKSRNQALKIMNLVGTLRNLKDDEEIRAKMSQLSKISKIRPLFAVRVVFEHHQLYLSGLELINQQGGVIEGIYIDDNFLVNSSFTYHSIEDDFEGPRPPAEKMQSLANTWKQFGGDLQFDKNKDWKLSFPENPESFKNKDMIKALLVHFLDVAIEKKSASRKIEDLL